jgi:hypothetical protein
MTTLGEILAELRDPEEVRRLLAEAGDLALMAKVEQAAGSDTCGFALQAVEHFVRGADSEAWVKLVGRIQDSSTPAQSCLGEMLRWAVSH